MKTRMIVIGSLLSLICFSFEPAFAQAPTVTGLSRSSGPTTGETVVVITGANFLGAAAVTFGSANALSFTVNSATQITAISPPGSPGTVDITVTTAGGASAASASDQYTYFMPVGAPTVSEWGMIVLVGCLGSGAVYSLRRRRSAP